MYELTEEAVEDIEGILEFSIADFGLQQTEEYYRSLGKCLEMLDDNPEMGNPAIDLLPGYRRFSHISHVIFYKARNQGILVVRVLHKSQDINKQFGDEMGN
jgi:toxin ParE1/3/4